MSANFRMLFALNFNQWSRNAKSPEVLWPLPSIDGEIEVLSEEDMYARNKAIIAQYYKN